MNNFEIDMYPYTHKIVIDIFYNTYLHTYNSYGDIIGCSALSTNKKYAKWLIEYRSLLNTLYHNKKWYISTEHHNDIEIMKYYKELKEEIDKY